MEGSVIKMEKEKWTISCSAHTYVVLEYNEQVVYTYDNDCECMEQIIKSIERRTGMKIQDIPRKSSVSSFDGLRFLYGGFKEGSEWL